MRIPLVSPTALTLAEHVSRHTGREVFVKHDNATHPRYGGNKVRKLEYLLADARVRGATDLITVGAAGSHHALATSVHGAAAGFHVAVVLCPQAGNEHVTMNLRADLAQGATVHPVSAGWKLLPAALAHAAVLRAKGRIPYVIPAGGSTPLGACGYIDAVGELATQLRVLGVGRIDAMVCALGSGATLAGMMAGARLHALMTEAWGVRVTPRLMSSRALVAWLATQSLRRSTPRAEGFSRADVRVIDDQFGDGYGVPTPAAHEALELFARDGIELDLTYTAKAAAGLLALARRDPPGRRYLFWNTLSSAPLGALVPDLDAPLPPEITALLQ